MASIATADGFIKRDMALAVVDRAYALNLCSLCLEPKDRLQTHWGNDCSKKFVEHDAAVTKLIDLERVESD